LPIGEKAKTVVDTDVHVFDPEGCKREEYSE